MPSLTPLQTPSLPTTLFSTQNLPGPNSHGPGSVGGGVGGLLHQSLGLQSNKATYAPMAMLHVVVEAGPAATLFTPSDAVFAGAINRPETNAQVTPGE